MDQSPLINENKASGYSIISALGMLGSLMATTMNLRTICLSKGIAQERLALDAGVDRTVVSKIERAVTNPSIEILLKLANQLDVDLNDLFAN